MTVKRVAVDLSNLSKQLDPLSIPTLTDAFFINHLYGNLVEYNEKQNIVSALAKNFYWQNENVLVFEFDKNSPINAFDALFNFQRTIFHSKNLHGDIFELICSPNESVDNCLKRLEVKDDKLFVFAANVKAKDFLLNVLASIDYKIVPIAAFNSTDFRVAKIKDYSITSGHYFLGLNNVFTRNNFEYLRFENNFKSFEIISATSTGIVDLVDSQNIDIITTTIPLQSAAIDFLKKKKFNIFETYPISIFFLSFSKKALDELTTSERFVVGNLILNELGSDSLFNSKSTEQFIQDFGQGYLTNSQLNTIKLLRETGKRFLRKPKKKIKLAVRNLERWKRFASKNPEFELVKVSGSVLNMPEDTRPDVFALTNDVSFETDLGLLTFAIKNNFLKLYNLTSIDIIKKFISLDSEQRISFINEVHFFSMKNCISFPLYASPYLTLTSDSISANQSKYNSRTLLWLLK